MLGRIYAIGINTFREAVRDRVLYGVVGCATAVLLFSLALAELSLNEQQRVVMDIGLASISLFAVIVAVFLGSSLLYKEIERKTLYVILPKPIHRAEFLLGKYAGIVLTALVFILLMGAVQLWVASVQAGAEAWALLAVPVVMGVALGIGMRVSRDRTAVLVPMSLAAALAAGAVAASAGVEVGVVAASLLLNAAEVAVVSAVALLFSSFSTPFLTGLLSLGVWIVGRSADDMASMRSDAIGPEVKSLLVFLSEIVPNFNLFVPGRQSLLDDSHGGPVVYVAETLGYAALYTAVVLFLAALIFRRRDFL